MQKKLPIGYASLSEIINGGFLYVDKTPFIANMALQKYYFLSRPRRFGKTLFLDTLKQAFLGHKELFRGLYLEHNWDWNKKYPIIHISFGTGSFNQEGMLQQGLDEILANCANMYDINFKMTSQAGRFSELIRELHKKYNEQVVILVDEYDKPILDAIDNTELAIKNRELLKGFYGTIKEHDANLKFVFVTGVTKFAKAGIFSQLNNLNDITFNSNYADICGYTQNDIETTFMPYLTGVDLGELKRWYNGYSFLGVEAQKVYNPFDILLFISNNSMYKNYWFETGTPTFLIKLLQKNNYQLPQLEDMLLDEMAFNSFDIDNLTIETLLLQSGYLTVTEIVKNPFTSGFDYKINYPNHEVRQSLNSALIHYLAPDKGMISTLNIRLRQALLNKDFVKLAEALSSFLAGVPYNWYSGKDNTMHNYEGYYCVILYSILNTLGLDARAEDASNNGRIDLSINVLDYRIIMEFKMQQYGDAASAISQIKSKGYAQKYKSENKPIYLMGISFDAKSKNIADFKWELEE